ncbi:MAG: hypothetical protein AAFO03_28610 [Bacteroidota bacterium]
MKSHTPSWWPRRKAKPKQETPEEKDGLGKDLQDEARKKLITWLIRAGSTFFLFLVIWMLGFTNVGDWWRDALKVKNDIIVMKHYSLEGIIVNCDSIAIEGLTVVVQGHDVNTAITDENGFFTAYIKLPATLEEVPIRFLDETNREIYCTLYSLDKDIIENDKMQVYTIPDEKLNQ